MKKTYWVKSQGSTEEWIEMTGTQFYEFVTSSAGKGRYFMDCDTYKIEVSQEQYRAWKLEENHNNYLHRFEDEVLILSLESLGEDNGISGEELAIDLSVSVEDEAISKISFQRLTEAILSLADDEQWLIHELFMTDKPKKERELAALTGVTQQAIHKKKNKILNKLKILVVKNENSQQ